LQQHFLAFFVAFFAAFLAGAFLATFFAAFFLATVTPPSRDLIELMSGKFHRRKLAAKLAWRMFYPSSESLQGRIANFEEKFPKDDRKRIPTAPLCT
jgi:hypothetical protein